MINTFDAAEWFIKKNKLATDYRNLKLNNLLYFSELMHFSVLKEKMFDKDFIAVENGVIVYDIYTHHGRVPKYSKNEDIETKYNIGLQIMKIINFLYAHKSDNELIEIIHSHNIWKEKTDLIPFNNFDNLKIEFKNASQDLIEFYSNIYNAYKDVNFDNLVMRQIGENYFYYFKDKIHLDEKMLSELSEYPKFEEPQFIVGCIDGEIVLA